KGAVFSGDNEKKLPVELENIFLKGVMETEKLFENGKMIRIGDKLGRPARFKPAAELSDVEIKNAWKALRKHMNKHGIDLGTCSPNIPARELYRFTLEELYEQEIQETELRGWTTHFIYDEFHPDIVYDNGQMAMYFIRTILNKEPLDWMSSADKQCFRL